MKSFTEATPYFSHQIIWISISFFIIFSLSYIDFRFLKRTDVLVALFFIFSGLLLFLFIAGHTSNGAKSWFSFGRFSFEPSDMMKLVVILMLAKYFSRRHVEIDNFKHIFISSLYALIPFLLVFLQPDFGSATFCNNYLRLHASRSSKQAARCSQSVGCKFSLARPVPTILPVFPGKHRTRAVPVFLQ